MFYILESVIEPANSKIGFIISFFHLKEQFSQTYQQLLSENLIPTAYFNIQVMEVAVSGPVQTLFWCFSWV